MVVRNLTKKSIRVILLLSIFIFIGFRSAHSYIDLGSGSYFFQILIATLLGVLFTVKTYWKKMKTFLSNLFSKEKK